MCHLHRLTVHDLETALIDVSCCVGNVGQTTAVKQSSAQLLGVRSVQIGVMLFVLQQFGGINAVMYFSTQVFKEVCSTIHSETCCQALRKDSM